MKVCTDSCIFGAWIAHKIAGNLTPVFHGSQIPNCLDIGTGTGLLSLMIAQKNNVQIDGVEINRNAYEQAKENFKISPWSKNLKALHGDARNSVIKKYDLIISNPPFYERDLKSGNEDKNIAKHDDGLNLDELITIVKNDIADKGYFSLLLPFHRAEHFKNIVENNGLYINEELLIKQTPHHNYFRAIFLVSADAIKTISSTLVIKDANHNYTPEFIALLRDYYLNL